MARGSPQADFFVLRAPLLAADTLSRWSEGVSALDACAGDEAGLERALSADRALLRARLACVADDDQIAEGLVLASPDLADGVERWRRDPAAKRSRSAERSLVRYLTRVASRPDLFGLAGAYALGQFSEPAQLTLAPRSALEIRLRLDGGVLRDVVRTAAAAAVGSDALIVAPNSGSYRVAGRLRVAARIPGSTSHRLLQMRASTPVELALEAAQGGASIGSLVAALQRQGIAADRAREVLQRLIASDLLIAVAQVTVTGGEPAAQAIQALRSLPDGEPYADAVDRAITVAASAPQVTREVVDTVRSALESTGIEVKRRRTLHVDSRRPGEIHLPPRVLAEMRRSIDLLARLTPPRPSALEAFSDAFERRFGTRSVPLLEALDPDFGIRLGVGGQEADVPADPGAVTRRRARLELIERGRSTAGNTVVLTDRDIASLSREHPATLPSAFGMLTCLIGRDGAAVLAGDFQLVEPLISGPSGARLLGRLCQGDPELDGHVRDHLRREAALEPDVILAELSVAPETEAGLNITQRPVLREWEIEYGGASGAPPERRLAPADLMISIHDGEVVLRSVSLGKRVVPSSTTAMNALWVSLPAARFLLSIPYQRITSDIGWRWDEVGDAPALPRVSHGRTILSLRRWNVTAAEFDDVRAGTDGAGFRRLQEWRERRALPRVVNFDHPRNRVLVDFGNVLSVDAFLATVEGLDVLRFIEWPVGDGSPVHGPDGQYAHELVIPFTLDRTSAPAPRRRRTPRPVSESSRRFAPGTEWLYANLYGPVAASDRVLVDYIAPLARRLREAGVVDRWFFVRYADPARHLRVRFHGTAGDLLGAGLPALHEVTAPALADGLLNRISMDTYEREVERYGGLEGVDLMERAAEVDSEAVTDLLVSPIAPARRRQLTVASLAALYADADLPIEASHRCCVRLRVNWAPDDGRSLGALLGSGERAERAEVARTVAALHDPDPEPAILALRDRSPRLRPILGQLRELDERGILEQPFDDVICSLAHMSVNRLLRRGGNHDELRVHDALARLYESQIGRAKRNARPANRDGGGRRREVKLT